MHGWTLSEQGRESEGIDQMREGNRRSRCDGYVAGSSALSSVTGAALSKAQSSEEALRVLDEAIAMVNNKGERYYEAELYRLKGELLLKTRSNDEAEHCFKNRLGDCGVAESEGLATPHGDESCSGDLLKSIYDSF
jgi:predicted ATPase